MLQITQNQESEKKMKANNKFYKNLSNQFIVEALLEIMEEKPYSEISVAEITDRAQIARRTFYYNYKDKDDVIQEYIQILFLKFKEYIFSHKAKTPQECATIYFKFWKNEKTVIPLLKKNNLFPLLLEKYESVLAPFTADDILRDFHCCLNEKEEKYFKAFNAAGLWILLDRWIKSGATETPEEMAAIYVKIMGLNLK